MRSPPRELLDVLEPRERLVSLYGFQRIWPRLRNDVGWHRRIDQARLALNLTPLAHGEILMQAGKVARALRDATDSETTGRD